MLRGIRKVLTISGLLLTATVLSAGLVTAGCGSEESSNTGSSSQGGVATPSQGSSFQRVVSTDKIFTVDDVVSAGFKKSKTYDVTGLEKATGAIYGFYGEDAYNRQEYELRLYASQQDAVQYGGPMAEEGSGPNAKVIEDEASWKEGLRERRACLGDTRGYSHHVGKCTNAKYGDYMIVGNLVMLCQGKDSAAAIANCNALRRQLGVQ